MPGATTWPSWPGSPAAPRCERPCPPLVPLSVRKVGFRSRVPAAARRGNLLRSSSDSSARSRGARADPWETLDTASIDAADPPARSDPQAHLPQRDRRQRSVLRASCRRCGREPMPGTDRPGLVLTLHGAGVEAIGQADAYAPKPGLHIVAPTNRRPYGFDWEDWGRLDAIEVLELAQKVLGTDPRRTYLTGHSMGGHGTWHLGVTYPDRFAAIAPSAGWISMWSYAGARRAESPDPVEQLMARAGTPSDTLALVAQPRLAGRLRPARRCRRQRARRSGPADATGPGRVPPRFRLSRTARRRALVGQRLRRLAAAVCVPRAAHDSAAGRGAPDRFHHRQPGRLASCALG